MTYPYEQEMLQFMAYATQTDALYAQWARQQGISPNMLAFFYALTTRTEPYTPSQFCDTWGMPKQTLTSIMREQEKRGLFELVPVPGNAKLRHMRLTPSGTAYAEEMLHPLWQAEMQALEQMGKQKVRLMVELEREFNQAFTATLKLNEL